MGAKDGMRRPAVVAGCLALVVGCLAAERAAAQPQFEETLLPTTGAGSGRLLVGDLDGDLDVDIVWEDGYRNLIVLLNDGRGNLSAAAGRLPPLPPDHVQILRDLDNDGDLDILFALPNLGMLRNDGRGYFQSVTLSSSAVNTVDVGDLDRDGDLDVATTGTSGVEFYTNLGNGTFRYGGFQIDQPQVTGVIKVGDFNRDGFADLVGKVDLSLGVFLNSGSGRLRLTQAIPIASTAYLQDIEMVDVDGDDDMDLLEVNATQSLLLTNDGTGRFTESVGALPARIAYASSAVFADVDGDNDVDLFLGTGISHVGPEDHLYLNDGTGRFVDVTGTRLVTPMLSTWRVGAADMDGDGDMDLIACHPSASGRVYRNLLRDATFRGPVRIGAPATLGFYARRGFATTPQVVLGALTTRTAIPPFLLRPLGLWRLDPQGLILLPALLASIPGGDAMLTLTVPAEEVLVGQTVSMQAVVVHDADPSTWRFTNLAQATIVR